MRLNECKILNLPLVLDDRGSLTFIENDLHIPFPIQRVYYLYNVPGKAIRGAHGHRKLQQIIIPLSGQFDILLDDGFQKKEMTLSDPAQGLYVAPMMWRDVYHFSPGAVCLVLASLPYQEEDYFRHYDHFLQAARGQAT